MDYTLLPGDSDIREFEYRIADYYQCEYCIAVCSATMGIMGVFFALGLKGAEVITTPLTWPGALSGPLMLECTLKFCDVEEPTLTLNPDLLENLISPETKAVFTADFLGYPCRLDKVQEICKKHGLLLIHDSASSFGSLYRGLPSGYYADVTILSFGAKKTFSLGEGGCVLTNRSDLYELLLKCITHPDRHIRETSGYHPFALNMRMNPLAAEYGNRIFHARVIRIETMREHINDMLCVRGIGIHDAFLPNYHHILCSHGNLLARPGDWKTSALPIDHVVYKDASTMFSASKAGPPSCSIAEELSSSYTLIQIDASTQRVSPYWCD